MTVYVRGISLRSGEKRLKRVLWWGRYILDRKGKMNILAP